MSESNKISTDDLTDEQIERVLNTNLFQKGLAYSRLADGIEVLEEEDEIFESMVQAITKQHGNIRSDDSTREVLRLFRAEIATFTEPLVDEDDGVDANDVEDIYVEEDDDE